MYKRLFKRIFDLVISLLLFSVTIPMFLLVGLLLLIINRTPPFFLQKRPGRGERIFKVIKFKTMNDKKDSIGNLLPDAQRLTPIGRLVRQISLDEIPQLLNVIKGDMSLVGPRPLLVEYLPLYNEHQHRRHEVRPGITGWAQVNGRNAIDWEEKFDYDVWYVDHISFKLDIKILWMTAKKVIRSEGISQNGHATMPLFKGDIR